MSFKIDEVLVEILPEKVVFEKTGLSPTEWAWCLEQCFCQVGCTRVRCRPEDPALQEIREGLAGLKRELREMLAEREVTIEGIEKDLSPANVSEVDKLQNKLHSVLVELDELKAKLKENGH
jgi:hypothetical protein